MSPEGGRKENRGHAGIPRCRRVDEGMEGISTRFAFKVLAATFNHDNTEISADPVHLMYVLEQSIKREQFAEDTEKRYLDFIKSELAPRFAEFIGKEIQMAYLNPITTTDKACSTGTWIMPDAWIEGHDFKDPNTGQPHETRYAEPGAGQNREASGYRKPEGFSERCCEVHPSREKAKGRNPPWTSHEKIRGVIERCMFSQVEDLMPVIGFGSKKDSETEKKHLEFVERMMARGYTERQVRRLVECST